MFTKVWLGSAMSFVFPLLKSGQNKNEDKRYLVKDIGLIHRQMSYLLRRTYRKRNPVKQVKRLLRYTKGTSFTRNKDDLLPKVQAARAWHISQMILQRLLQLMSC